MKDRPESKKARNAKRREQLKNIAQSKGWASWTSFETAVINRITQILEKE